MFSCVQQKKKKLNDTLTWLKVWYNIPLTNKIKLVNEEDIMELPT